MENGDISSQSNEEILSIVKEARKPGEGPKLGGNHNNVLGGGGGSMDFDGIEAFDDDTDDMETSDGDFVCAL